MKEPTPKMRLVYGQKLPQQTNYEADKPSNKKPTAKKTTKSASKAKAVPHARLKAEAWADYFAKMAPTERILMAFTAYRQPLDVSVDQFYSYGKDSFRQLDKDLPGPDYQEVATIVSKWKKLGLLVAGYSYNSLSLEDGAAAAFWEFINKQVQPELVPAEPEKAYTADLPGTLDNLFNFLVMVEHEEVLFTGHVKALQTPHQEKLPSTSRPAAISAAELATILAYSNGQRSGPPLIDKQEGTNDSSCRPGCADRHFPDIAK